MGKPVFPRTPLRKGSHRLSQFWVNLGEVHLVPLYIFDGPFVLAKLKLTMIPGAQTKEQKLKTLDILSQPGGIYRNAAVEILVAFELELGNPNKAIEFLKSHIQDAEASRAQVQRMAELLVALGSEPESGN